MFGKSRIEADKATQAGTSTPSKPNGAMMLLKSMGFDPQEFMDTINGARAEYELAKTASVQTVIHFNARLDRVEQRLETIHTQLESILSHVMLSHVVSDLEVTTEPNTTQQDTTEGTVIRGGL